MSINNSNQEILDRGKRLRQIRDMFGLSQRAFAELCQFKQHASMAQWENGDGNGLPEQRSRQIINIVNNAKVDCRKIYCSHNWLFFGSGEPPKFVIDNLILSDHDTILSEVNYFRQLANSTNVATLEVTDNDMLPIFGKNDYVGGIWLFGEELPKIENKICIVMLANNTSILRLVTPGSTDNTYHLQTIDMKVPNLLPNVEITSAAIVTRHWKAMPT